MIPVPRFTGNLQAWANQLTAYLRMYAEQTFPVKLRHLATDDDAKAVEDGVLMYQPVNTSVVCSCGEGWRQLLSVHTVAEGADPLQSVLTIQGAVGQTSNLQEWQDSAGTTLAVVSETGNIEVGSDAVSTDGCNLGTGGTFRSYRTGRGNVYTHVGNRCLYAQSLAIDYAPIVARGFAGQTANLQQWEDSTGATLVAVLANGNLQLASSGPPATSSATGLAGEVAWDSSYMYVCVSTNNWKRISLQSW